MTIAEHVFETNVKSLPANEQLRLASMILSELTHKHEGIDVSTDWSDEDIGEAVAYSVRSHEEEDAAKVENLLLQRLQGPPAIEVTNKTFQDIQARVKAHFHKGQ